MPVPVEAGDIAMFSSLTPHRTGPNRTNEIRKSYIVQFAPDGARRIDRTEGGRHEIPQNDEARQYFVVKNGEIVQ